MKKKTIAITILLAIVMLLAACNSLEGDQAVGQRVPIKLTTSIAPTRGVQDEQIVSGQTVYVWAKAEDGGTADWSSGDCYIEAWKLTAGESGALTSANSTTYYYPPQSLSMVALHGNFDYTEGQTPFPAVVSHSVLSDQSTAGNLEQSDLLYARLNSVSASASPIGITFAHKLSKIEITLSSSIYTDAEIDAMTVTLNNVLPTIDLSLTDGQMGAAHGNTIAVTPRKTATAAANSHKAVFEAVIPAQTRPTDFITVRLNGGVVNVDAQVTEFEANKRYPYTVDVTYRDVRKNPLWYVAEYNVNYDGAGNYSFATTPDEGYFFSWNDAMKAFTTTTNANAATPLGYSYYYIADGSKLSGWHLPTTYEYASIVPGWSSSGTTVNIYEIDPTTSGGTYKEAYVLTIFGYDKTTMSGDVADNSYWVTVTDKVEVHALRYLGTDYCSAWKYEMLDGANGKFYRISATLIDKVENSEAAASAWYAAHWNDVYFGNNETIGAVQRVFAKRGYNQDGSAATANNTAEDYNYGVYWATTAGWRLWAGNYGSHVNGFNPTKGCSVRLFRNNGANIRLNPLYYVAMYDVMYGGTGDFQATGPYKFASSSNEGHYYVWGSSEYKGMSWFGPTDVISPSTDYDTYYTRSSPINGIGTGYHLPIVSEWKSIAPCVRGNLFDLASVGNSYYNSSGVNVKCAAFTGGVNDYSYWYRESANVIWAIRYLGTAYCSVWKYEKSGTWEIGADSKIQITSRLVGWVDNTESAASAALTSYRARFTNDVNWGIVSNDPEVCDNPREGVCRRTFYARGNTSSTLGSAASPDTNIQTRGHWLSATSYSSGAYCWIFYISNSYLSVHDSGKELGFNVRLFRDK